MKAQIKVCFLIAGFGEGGAQKQCIYLINELQQRGGVDVHLIYFYEGINFDLLENRNLTCWKLERRSFYNPQNIISILRIVNRVKPDVLFSWLQSSDVYAYFVRLLCSGRPSWVLAERDSAYPSDWRFRLRKFLGRRADLIVANSEKGVSYWVNSGVLPRKVLRIPNVLNPRSADLGLECASPNRIVFAGRLELQKNVINVTRAFLKITEVVDNVDCVLIGNGSLASKVSELITGFDRVQLLPFQKNIEDFFVKASVFVNISHHEGMPNTVMENIALNKRVVVSRINEHVALLGHDYPYYVKDPSDIDEIASVVLRALRDPYVEEDYIFAKGIMSKMSPGCVAAQYIEAFESI